MADLVSWFEYLEPWRQSAIIATLGAFIVLALFRVGWAADVNDRYRGKRRRPWGGPRHTRRHSRGDMLRGTTLASRADIQAMARARVPRKGDDVWE